MQRDKLNENFSGNHEDHSELRVNWKLFAALETRVLVCLSKLCSVGLEHFLLLTSSCS